MSEENPGEESSPRTSAENDSEDSGIEQASDTTGTEEDYDEELDTVSKPERHKAYETQISFYTVVRAALTQIARDWSMSITVCRSQVTLSDMLRVNPKPNLIENENNLTEQC